MPHRRHHHRGEPADQEAPSPRPSAAGCYAFLRSASTRRAGGYRRLDSAVALKGTSDADTGTASAAVRVEVGTATARDRSVFHVEPAVLDAGPVRRLVAAAGRRLVGGGVAVAVDALLFEHLLWLATTTTDGDGDGAGDGCAAGSDDDLSEIVEFYSHDDDEEHRF